MCHSLLDEETYALARDLLAQGIPLEEAELERMREACVGLWIYEDGPSFAFNLQSGAGYVFSASIWNESKQCLSSRHIGFGGLAWEHRMHLLPDPREDYPMRLVREARRRKGHDGERDYLIARETYSFECLHHLHEYPRESALNHLIGPRQFLYPGDPPLEGFLLAVGPEPIPWDYADGDRLKVRVRVFDQKCRSSAAWFHPAVERSREEKRLMEKIASSGRAQRQEERTARPSRFGIRVDADLAQEKTTATSRQPEPLKDPSKNEIEIGAQDIMTTVA